MDKKITVIDALPKLEKKLKVAAYCRVSSGKDAMLHSLSNQVSYYNNLIYSTKGWEFAGVYADEAISGTKNDREEFKRLIDDANAGKINLIIVKSISRFARNTLTMLEIIRELKALGVDVYFEEQRLHSISSEGEMVLTFLASFAQEEARSVSENMKWRVRKNFEQGYPWALNECYGYQWQDRKLVVKPEGAKVVKRIFDMYLSGMGMQAIANILNEENIKPMRIGKWRGATVRYVLTNINYTGDLLLQKYYSENFMSKKKVPNKGIKAKYLVENDHEPIISRETFYKAQELMAQRADYYNCKRRPQVKHSLATRIRCGICGNSYAHKTTQYSTKWICSTYNREGKKYCASKAVPEDEINRLVREVLNDDLTKLSEIVVYPNNTIVFNLVDGTSVTKTWNDYSRKKSWTLEMKEKAREKAYQYLNEKKKEVGPCLK